MDTITFQKEAAVQGAYDVVVCGGGPSGIMAAIAAARDGAKVALVERYGFLGGMATAGLVAPISVFRYNDELVIGGIPWEFIQRMVKAGGAQVEMPLGNVSFRTESFKIEAQRMVLEAGVDLYLHAWLSGCRLDGENRVTHVIMETKSGTWALEAGYVVDCTGDGDVCATAGVPMQEYHTPPQPASLYFRVGGVDTDKVDKIHHSQQGINYHMEPLRDLLREVAKTREVPQFGGPWMCWTMAPGELLVNATRIRADMTDERDQTRAECRLREDVCTLLDILREYYEPFRNAYLIETAPQAGVRETRHVKGAYVLSGKEYAAAVNFDDAIGRGCHPIDIHDYGTDSQTCHFLENAAYIPYRCLYAPGFPNLLAGSRCLSADREASASIRVMGSIMGVGQAAGLAASMCRRAGCAVDRVNVRELRKKLTEWGAVGLGD